MHKQIQLTEWISQENIHHMPDSCLYTRRNHIVEVGFPKAPGILMLMGMINLRPRISG